MVQLAAPVIIIVTDCAGQPSSDKVVCQYKDSTPCSARLDLGLEAGCNIQPVGIREKAERLEVYFQVQQVLTSGPHFDRKTARATLVTGSRQITEVTQRRARLALGCLVLGWVTVRD